jgi:hypothetical protein
MPLGQGDRHRFVAVDEVEDLLSDARVVPHVACVRRPAVHGDGPAVFLRDDPDRDLARA